MSANFLIKIKKERLDLQIHRSVANALIIVRFDSENFIELRYGLFFGEYDYAIPWINDAFSRRDHDTVSTDDAGNQHALW